MMLHLDDSNLDIVVLGRQKRATAMTFETTARHDNDTKKTLEASLVVLFRYKSHLNAMHSSNIARLVLCNLQSQASPAFSLFLNLNLLSMQSANA